MNFYHQFSLQFHFIQTRASKQKPQIVKGNCNKSIFQTVPEILKVAISSIIPIDKLLGSPTHQLAQSHTAQSVITTI